jgi:quinol monooxygenase YgiN
LEFAWEPKAVSGRTTIKPAAAPFAMSLRLSFVSFMAILYLISWAGGRMSFRTPERGRVMLRVVARVPARKDKAEEVAAILKGLIEPTRQEDGCVRYELWRNTAEPADFTFVEEWQSAEALERHLRTSHVTAALASLEGLLDGAPDIRTYGLA